MNHHAYVYIGDPKRVLPPEIATPAVDIEHIEVERFSIADARALKLAAYRRPQQKDVLQIVITATLIPVEAQNALLKILEEPPQSTVLHVCVPRRDQLIATILSRVELTEGEKGVGDDTPMKALEEFVALSYKERLALIEGAHKKKETSFFTTLAEQALAYVEKHCRTNHAVLRTVLYVGESMRAPGASKKMLAEELAFALPYHR